MTVPSWSLCAGWNTRRREDTWCARGSGGSRSGSRPELWALGGGSLCAGFYIDGPLAARVALGCVLAVLTMAVSMGLTIAMLVPLAPLMMIGAQTRIVPALDGDEPLKSEVTAHPVVQAFGSVVIFMLLTAVVTPLSFFLALQGCRLIGIPVGVTGGWPAYFTAALALTAVQASAQSLRRRASTAVPSGSGPSRCSRSWPAPPCCGSSPATTICPASCSWPPCSSHFALRSRALGCGNSAAGRYCSGLCPHLVQRMADGPGRVQRRLGAAANCARHHRAYAPTAPTLPASSARPAVNPGPRPLPPGRTDLATPADPDTNA